MARKLIGILAAAICLSAGPALGQDMLEDLYGRGVHAFFSQRTADAYNALNAAIVNGSRDPRAYYFRGLALNRLGRPDEAKNDFRTATQLEMLGGQPYSVGRALERIQGSERMLLETHRNAARVTIHALQLSQDRARYEQIQRTEADVLRGTGVVPAAPRAVPGVIAPAASDPFGPAAAPPAALPAPAVVPAPIPPAPAPTPLAPAPAPATPPPAPSTNDPFAEPA